MAGRHLVLLVTSQYLARWGASINVCGMQWNECHDAMQIIVKHIIRKSFLIIKRAIVHVKSLPNITIVNYSALWINPMLPTIYCFYEFESDAIANAWPFLIPRVVVECGSIEYSKYRTNSGSSLTHRRLLVL